MTYTIIAAGCATILALGCDGGGSTRVVEPDPTPAEARPVFRSLSRTPLALSGERIVESTSVLQGGTASVAIDPSSGMGALSFQKKDLKLEFGRGELPEDFPADVPIPSNARIVTVLHGPGMPTQQVLLEVPMAYTDFRPRYEEDLWRSNWKPVEEKAIPKSKGKTLVCRKDERNLTVTMKDAGSNTLLTLQAETGEPVTLKPAGG